MRALAPLPRLRSLAAQTFGLVSPRVCAACGAGLYAGEGTLCAACAIELAVSVAGPDAYCRSCGDAAGPHLLVGGRCTSCRLGRSIVRFERLVRVGHYAGSLRALILRFKQDYTLDGVLGDLLVRAIAACHVGPIDVWIPIPTPWRRRLSRGFQPTQLLARSIATSLGGCTGNLMTMTRHVPPFHGSVMSRIARETAIRGAFRIGRGVDLSGCRVGIVDDVTNTGATLAEARRVVRGAGASQVFGAVLAKTLRGAAEPSALDPSSVGA